jgi:hypothetical protein
MDFIDWLIIKLIVVAVVGFIYGLLGFHEDH